MICSLPAYIDLILHIPHYQLSIVSLFLSPTHEKQIQTTMFNTHLPIVSHRTELFKEKSYTWYLGISLNELSTYAQRCTDRWIFLLSEVSLLGTQERTLSCVASKLWNCVLLQVLCLDSLLSAPPPCSSVKILLTIFPNISVDCFLTF